MLHGPAEDALIEAIMAVHGQIDFLWQFFVTVHIAIFALLLLYDHAVESLNVIGRGFAVAGIAAFEWINGNALAGAYALLDSMHEQYRANYGRRTGSIIRSMRTSFWPVTRHGPAWCS